MVQTIAGYCLAVLFVCMGLNLIRLVKGPTNADRALSADTIFLNLISITTVYSISLHTGVYFDLILVFSLLGFVATVCFSKFVDTGKIIQ